MKRQKVFFDVRVDTDENLEQVAARVGQALDCAFTKGESQGRRAQVSYVLGLKVSIEAEYGIGGKKVASLVGGVAEKGFRYAPDGSGFAEYDQVDVTAYVVDLLTIRTGLQWYRPTEEDRAAEREAGRGIDDWHGGIDP